MTFVAGVIREEGDALEVCRRMFPSPVQRSAARLISPSPNAALGLVFHPTLPEDTFDHQPLVDSRYVFVGDVRIDNRPELYAKLGLGPAIAAAMADSQLFEHCWLKWHSGCVSHVFGGFAVALWDKQQQELFLIRDHCGERPIYYTGNGSSFAFASLPQGLRHIPGIDTRLNPVQLLNYLTVGPDSSGGTYFNHVLLLRPGHWLHYRRGEIQCQRYWHPADTSPTILKSDDEYVEAILERFDGSVQARLRSSGSIGSQLSGGMDSSSVTATAARLLGSQKLTAFTAIPQAAFANVNPVGRFGDERVAAAAVATMYPNIDHVLVEPSGQDLFQVIERTGRLTDSPVFNPMNQMWMNAMLDEARRREINVMLQAACGNATLSFGGLVGLAALFQEGKWSKLLKQIAVLRTNGHTSWSGAAYWAAGISLPLWARKLVSQELRDFSFAYSPVHPDREKENRLRQRAFDSFFGSDSSVAHIRRKIFDYYDVGFANAGISLGWGISFRDAMQDKRVFEFCLSIPIEQYLAGGQTRSLVRRSMRDRLPPEVLACTTRGLQSADWYLTMGSRRKEMADELKLIAQSPLARHLLDIERLQNLLDTWPASGFERADVSDSWHLALSRGLAVGNFIRHFEAH